MCTQDNIGTGTLLGKVTSRDFIDELNSALAEVLSTNPDPAPDVPFHYVHLDLGNRKSREHDFEVCKVLARIVGDKPEEAFLYVEIIVKGRELTPIELHMPLPTCNHRYFINKNAASLIPDGALPVIREFFQETANSLEFGDTIDF